MIGSASVRQRARIASVSGAGGGPGSSVGEGAGESDMRRTLFATAQDGRKESDGQLLF